MDDEDTAENKAEFKYLCYVPDGRWKFHKKDDVEIVDPKFVFYGPVQATSISKAGYHFGDDDIQASNVYRNIKTINWSYFYSYLFYKNFYLLFPLR